MKLALWVFCFVLLVSVAFLVGYFYAVISPPASFEKKAKESLSSYQDDLREWAKNISVREEDFPKAIDGPLDFSGVKFGAAISAFQTEGENGSADWFHYLVKVRPEDREKFLKMSGHWQHWKEDCGFVKDLGLDVMRISIEWSRIEPQKDEFNLAAMEHYAKEIACYEEAGVATFVTLHHFSNPADFSWEDDDAAERFLRYVQFVVRHLSSRVRLFITINEPYIIIYHGYYKGIYPPNRNLVDPGGISRARKAYLNLLRAHKGSYLLIHRLRPNAMVGIVTSFGYHTGQDAQTAMAAEAINELQKLFDDFIAYGEYADFIGVNYYKETELTTSYTKGEMIPKFWISPKGLYKLLLELKEYKKPIFVTEIGFVSDRENPGDVKRQKYLLGTLYWIRKAMDEGAPVKMVLYWSFIDTFEWDFYDFSSKMGLIAVDFESEKLDRQPRPLAYLYKEIIRTKKIAPKLWQRIFQK